MSLMDLSVSQLQSGLAAGEFLAVDVCQAYLDTIERLDGNLAAFLHVDSGAAMQLADAIDHRRETGQARSALAGIPIAVKNNICLRGGATTAGSRMLADFMSPYDATVIERLKAADAIVLGRTNLDEFAMGSSTENSCHGPTRNPWDLQRVPGGSSGGSAAAVAARMVPLALGSDTGGSIRQPASFCGVTGIKPTYGRVSRYGLVAFASSLDQIGALARTAEDVAHLLHVVAGHDHRDSTSARADVPPYVASLQDAPSAPTIGIIREHFDEGLNDDVQSSVREALRMMAANGARLVDLSMPHSRYAIATYYIIAPCEASSNLARYDGAHYGFRAPHAEDPAAEGPLVAMYRTTRSLGFGPEVKRRIMLGTYALSAGYYDAYYLKAMKVRRLIRQDYDDAFRKVDLIAGPVSPIPAFRLGEKIDNPLEMYLSDLYTVSANLAGVPAMSVPCGRSRDGLPIGLQLQAPAFDETRLLQIAHWYQQLTEWHWQRPGAA